MAQPSQQSPVFEVRCQSCDVSFPIGTKQCVHCGQKIGRPRFLALGASEEGVPVLTSPAEVEEAEVETEPRGGRWLRAGFTIFWLLLAILSATARSCQGE
jgi:hypothetical protein